MATRFSMGISLWTQGAAWSEVMEAALLVEELGFDHLWTVDHWLAPYGEPDQPILDGWTVLAGWATRTSRIPLGLYVGANTFRPPTQTAKLTTTLDHLSGGRAMLGLGAGWFEREHAAYGIEFGRSPGERIGWLDESVGIVRRLLDGETVTADGGHYRAGPLRLLPRPIQAHVPIVIGGGGEKRTLRTVARHADIWNAYATPDVMGRKIARLREHGEAVGRDIDEIELTLAGLGVIRPTRAAAEAAFAEQRARHRMTPRNQSFQPGHPWLGSAEALIDHLARYAALGIGGYVIEMGAPFDVETMRLLAGEVRAGVEARASSG